MGYVQEAQDALSMNQADIMDCKITVALAAHLGGLGTHPIIIHHVRAWACCHA
jgi:hypothetical protein